VQGIFAVALCATAAAKRETSGALDFDKYTCCGCARGDNALLCVGRRVLDRAVLVVIVVVVGAVVWKWLDTRRTTAGAAVSVVMLCVCVWGSRGVHSDAHEPSDILPRHQALWRALRMKREVVVARNGITSVVLPDGVYWLTEANSTMLVRACWETLHQRVQAAMSDGVASNGFLVTGDPGIGKSWFLSYELYNAVAGNRDVVLESVERDLIWHFSRTGRVTEYPAAKLRCISAINDAGTLYLFDPAGSLVTAREPRRVAAFTLICASPNPVHYHTFMKHTRDSSRNPGKAYMPQPDLEELQEMRAAAFPLRSTREVNERFELFGGVPRFVFADEVSHERDVLSLHKAIAACSAASVVESVRQTEALNDVSHRLVRYVVAADLKSVSSVQFASRAVGTMVCDKLDNAAEQAVKALANSLRGVDGGAFGAVFECYVHRALAAGGTFPCSALGRAPALVQLVVPPLPVHEMRVAADVATAGVAVGFWRPSLSNYPAFDGFMRLAAGADMDALQVKSMRGPHVISATAFGRGCPNGIGKSLRLFWAVPAGPEYDNFALPTVEIPPRPAGRRLVVTQYKLSIAL
jgi:hypothetical protein